MAYEIVETELDPKNYTVDPNAPELQKVTNEQSDAISDLETTYWGNDGKSGLIGNADKFYKDLAANAEAWGERQTQLQQEQTDFTIEKIEQQKDQAKKDYTKEQSGAYVDWQKQSNEYGANAEAMAAQGFAGSGYSESAQVSMYNTYQNRVTAARDSYNQAVLNYDNAIKDAKLANNAALAEIAYKTLQTTLELSLQGFQYKNQLISELADKKLETNKYYTSLWQSVWNNLLEAEKVELETDKFNTDLAESQRQAKADDEIKQAQLAIQQAQENRAQEQWEYQQKQARIAKANEKAANGRPVGQGSAKTTKTKLTNDEKKLHGGDKYASAIKAGNTANANKKYNSLAMMSGQIGSKKAIANSIVSYAALGEINTNEAAYMLNKFGYKVSDYLK